jgi:hypothetical protein
VRSEKAVVSCGGKCFKAWRKAPFKVKRQSMPKLVIDVHIHIAAKDQPGCTVSPTMRRSPAFLYVLARNGVDRLELAKDFDGVIRNTILSALNTSRTVKKGVLLAMDWIYCDGKRQKSHLVVSNDYVRQLARENRKVLFGASVNPVRPDAREELERCLTDEPPAALVKWIPNSQWIDPSDRAHDWFYERLCEEKVPLLCHTGPEHAIPVPDPEQSQKLGNPRLLTRALDIGVTVIAAHCATRFFPFENYDYLAPLARMMKEADDKGRWKLFTDVSAMCTTFRAATVDKVLKKIPGHRMVLGSDFPIPIDSMPPVVVRGLTLEEYFGLFSVQSPIEKNYQQLLAMGFPETIGFKAAELLNPKALA